MIKYVVTSDRLIWPRGSELTADALSDVDIDYLLSAGHLSAQKPKKSAKTKEAVEE